MEGTQFRADGQDKSDQSLEPKNYSTQNPALKAPTIELPKGGGAIRGIGESLPRIQ